MAARTYPQLALDRQLCFALYSASRAVVRAYGPLLEAADLTYTQYVTMLALWDAGEAAPTVGELGERLDLDSGTLTPLLKRLERAEYVRRQRDVGDERRVRIEVTDQGWALRDQLAAVPETLAAKFAIDPVAGVRLRDELKALTVALSAAE